MVHGHCSCSSDMVFAKSMFGLLCLIVVVDAQGKTTEINSFVVQCAVYIAYSLGKLMLYPGRSDAFLSVNSASSNNANKSNNYSTLSSSSVVK